MGFESLDCGCPVRKPPDRREALHGQVKSIAVLIAGPAVAVDGDGRRQRHTYTHTHTRQMMSRLVVEERSVYLQTHFNTRSDTDMRRDPKPFSQICIIQPPECWPLSLKIYINQKQLSWRHYTVTTKEHNKQQAGERTHKMTELPLIFEVKSINSTTWRANFSPVVRNWVSIKKMWTWVILSNLTLNCPLNHALLLCPRGLYSLWCFNNTGQSGKNMAAVLKAPNSACKSVNPTGPAQI